MPETEVLAVWMLTASLLSPCVVPWTVSKSWLDSGIFWEDDSAAVSCNPSPCVTLASEASDKNNRFTHLKVFILIFILSIIIYYSKHNIWYFIYNIKYLI